LVYAATELGILRSFDDGASWSPIDHPAVGKQIFRKIAISPDGLVYAYDGNRGTLHRGNPTGDSWTRYRDSRELRRLRRF